MKKKEWLVAACVAFGLAGCGGGGSTPVPTGSGNNNGGGNGGSPVASAPTMSIDLSPATVSSATPATVTVTLKDATGKAVPGALVTFTTKLGLGKFSPAAGTALTNSSGQASISLVPASSDAAGADEVSASANVSGSMLTVKQGFQLTATSIAVTKFQPTLTSLGAYGQTDIAAEVSGAAVGVPVTISLSSTCAGKGAATISPTSVVTTSGKASFVYKDSGCGATDSSDRITATVAGTTASANTTIALQPPTATRLTFGAATPSRVYLKGSGYTDVSSVSFVVRDQQGNKLQGQPVTLELTTYAGGMLIDNTSGPVTKNSDQEGMISVTVSAGTVPTPVRVKASLAGGISTVSNELSVGVGLPSQINFSLAVGTFNIEGGNYDNERTTITVSAADRSGNPIPENTAISFVTEGGQVEPSAFTALSNGLSQGVAQFWSQEPRPADGRVTVTAYAEGEESFFDANGNNAWDSSEPFQDLGDIYRDRTRNGKYDAAQDETIPYGKSLACKSDPLSVPPLVKDISIPTKPGTCDGTWGRSYVRRNAEIVFSQSSSNPLWGTIPVGTMLSGTSLTSLQTSALQADGTQIIEQYQALCGGSGCRSVLYPEPLKEEEKVSCQAAFDGQNASTSAQRTLLSVGGGELIFSYTAGTGSDDLSKKRSSTASCYRQIKTGSFYLIMADSNQVRLNPMPAGTKVSATASEGVEIKVLNDAVANTTEATGHAFTYTLSAEADEGLVMVSSETPRGLKTSVPFTLKKKSATYIPTKP